MTESVRLSYTETQVQHMNCALVQTKRKTEIFGRRVLSDLQLEERVDFSYPSIHKINFFDFYPGQSVQDAVPNNPFPGSVITEEGPYQETQYSKRCAPN